MHNVTRLQLLEIWDLQHIANNLYGVIKIKVALNLCKNIQQLKISSGNIVILHSPNFLVGFVINVCRNSKYWIKQEIQILIYNQQHFCFNYINSNIYPLKLTNSITFMINLTSFFINTAIIILMFSLFSNLLIRVTY
jgi:hypothetical protein